MKKYIFLSLIFTFIIPNITFGVLSDSLGLDMYKKVDKGLYDLEVKYLEKELKGGDVGGSITDDLNKRAKENGLNDTCFKKDITVSEIKKIVNDYDLSDMLKECFGEEDSKIGSVVFAKYVDIIKESYNENSIKAEKKVDEIYKIGRIGMYSDGLDENSPFDLMIDLDDIDKIIFEENIPYDGVNVEDLGKITDGILSGLNPSEAFELGRYKKPKNTTTTGGKIITDGSKQVCTTNNSGLDPNSLNNILGNGNGNGSNTQGTSGNSTNTQGEYSKVNDNPVWPCNQYFCIIIKFVMYNHKLLGGGTNLSIEGLIKRSNEHLKKAASTSLIQANMTVNNFQLGLKDLNLPDLFHVGIQVSYKPVPIMNVEKDNKDKSSDEFKHKNLLTRYYRNLSLDYERANDLTIFKKEEGKLKSLLDSTELSQTKTEDKTNNLENYISQIKKENEFISNTIVDKKIIQEDMQNFYKQFVELESFTNAMLDYTIGIGGIIKKMEEIPIKG